MSARKVTLEMIQRLQELAKADNLTPEAVVTDAKEENSPLHSYFEWDDPTAAHGFRIGQARTLIRSVHVEVEVNEVTLQAPRYVHDPRRENNQGYVELETLRDDPEAARSTMRGEFSRAISALRRANAVAGVLGLEAETQAAIDDLLKLSGRIEPEEETATAD